MRYTQYIGILACLLAIWGRGGAMASESGVLTFRGASDASAAVVLNARQIVIADDETNQLRIYVVNEPGLPLKEIDLDRFGVIDRKHPEMDIEGAARVGDRIYWIGSHGRNKDGELRVNRSCFFVTEVKSTVNGLTLVPTGRLYRRLVEDLLREPTAQALELERTVRLPLAVEATKKQLKTLAPKRRGLNIEALAVAPDGQTLYIGFRNPRLQDKADEQVKALVVPLENADAVLTKDQRPRFGPPILMDLKGLGLRSMTYVPHRKSYLLVAGSFDEGDHFMLYEWSGHHSDSPQALRSLDQIKGFRPEALVTFPTTKRLLLLSDDGSRKVPDATGKEVLNKSLLDLNKRTFRGAWLELD